MNNIRLSKFAIALAVTAGANSASAFMVDNSQQKTVVVSRTNEQTAQRVNVQPAPIVVKVSGTNEQQVYQAQPQTQPSYATTPTPQPQLTQTQTISVVPVSQQAQQNYSAQASQYAQAFDQLAVSTSSSAVAVFDLQTGQSIYAKNVDATRSIASISKVMTAIVLLDAGLDMREELTVIPSDLVGAKKASTNLKAGDRMTRSEFTLLMLMKSENPAAKLLARTYPGGYDAFIEAMNNKAQELGMYQTRFSDSSGLNPRNVSSANDLVKMMKVVNSDPRYHSIRNFSTAPTYDFYITNFNNGDRTYKANNTNRLVRSGNYPIGVQKTGYIREAGYCVVMETNVNNRPAIIVLLGGNTSNARWNDAENILTQLAYRQ